MMRTVSLSYNNSKPLTGFPVDDTAVRFCLPNVRRAFQFSHFHSPISEKRMGNVGLNNKLYSDHSLSSFCSRSLLKIYVEAKIQSCWISHEQHKDTVNKQESFKKSD